MTIFVTMLGIVFKTPSIMFFAFVAVSDGLLDEPVSFVLPLFPSGGVFSGGVFSTTDSFAFALIAAITSSILFLIPSPIPDTSVLKSDTY